MTIAALDATSRPSVAHLLVRQEDEDEFVLGNPATGRFVVVPEAGARLIELHDHLKVDFPVYAFFTKADLIAGFMEFFGNLPEQGRKSVWGTTFQTADKTANMIGDP